MPTLENTRSKLNGVLDLFENTGVNDQAVRGFGIMTQTASGSGNMTNGLVDVAIDRRSAERLLRELDGDLEALHKAVYRALKRAVRKMHQIARRIVAKKLGIAQKTAKKRIFADKVDWDELVAHVRLGKVGYDLKDMKARQFSKGVKVTVGERQLIPHAFMASVAGGRETVFMRDAVKRQGRDDHLAWQRADSLEFSPKSLPIFEQWTRSVSNYIDESDARRIAQMGAEEFEKRLAHEVGRLRGYKRGMERV